MLKKILVVISVLAGMSIPLHTKISNIALGLLLLMLLIIAVKEQSYKKVFVQKSFFTGTTIVFYLLIIFGAFYTEYNETVSVYLGRYALYLVIPLIMMLTADNILVTVRKNVFQGIVAGAVIASLYLNILNLMHLYTEYNTLLNKALFDYYHTYHHFTAPVKIHPTYFGMYLLVSLVILISDLMTGKKTQKKIGYGFAIFLLMATLVFVNSRICLLLMLLIVFAAFINWVVTKIHTHKIMVLTSIIVLIVTLSGVIYSVRNTYLFSRITTELVWDLSENVDTQYNNKFADDSRLSRWKVAWKLIEKQPVIGYGTGSEKKMLKQGYLEAGLDHAAAQEYDAHNQWLSFALEYGLVGVLFFFFFIADNLVRSYKKRDWIPSGLFLIILFISFTENIFKNNAGFLFIALTANLSYFTQQYHGKK